MAAADGAALVVACLRAAGVRRVFVAPGHGLDDVVRVLVDERLDVIAADDAQVASILADADGALALAPALGPGAALLPGRRLRLSSNPGAIVEPVELAVAELPAAIAGWSIGRSAAAVELLLPDPLEGTIELRPLAVQHDDRLVRLSAGLAGVRTVLLIGGGVVRSGHADDVAGAAERTGARIVSTPGAVGVVSTDHPSWSGVVGVQAEDARRSGLADAELVIAVGVDDDEPGALVPDAAQLVDLEPWHLAFLGLDWPSPPPAARGAAVVELEELFGPDLRQRDGGLHPVRAARDVLEVVGDARVAVDAGPVGLWFVRGVVSTTAGRVVTPRFPAEGFAAAAAFVGALDRSRVVGLTTPGDAVTPKVLGLAAELGLDVVVEQWGDETGDPSRHRAELVGARSAGGVHLLGVAVDLAAAAELVELAGPVILWG